MTARTFELDDIWEKKIHVTSEQWRTVADQLNILTELSLGLAVLPDVLGLEDVSLATMTIGAGIGMLCAIISFRVSRKI